MLGLKTKREHFQTHTGAPVSTVSARSEANPVQCAHLSSECLLPRPRRVESVSKRGFSQPSNTPYKQVWLVLAST